MPAFNSLDIVEIIETHQPALWVDGRTHECDDQTIGQTRIISNQLGYPGNLGRFECKDFDEAGLPVEVGFSPEREKKLSYEGKQHAVRSAENGHSTSSRNRRHIETSTKSRHCRQQRLRPSFFLR
jgi:hypothetical protein